MKDQSPSACAIIVAGGRGTRAAGLGATPLDRPSIPKQLQPLAGRSVIAWSIRAFARDPRFLHIIIVCPPDMRAAISEIGLPEGVFFAEAGPTRTASVRAGLARAADYDTDFIFIHDAARPGLDQACLDRLMQALLAGAEGCAPAQSVADALWHVDDAGFVSPQPRDGLMRVQTPQAFSRDAIIAAYNKLPLDQEIADDVAVVRAAGLTVVPVSGSHKLEKITWPQDFARMSAILSQPLFPRVGLGFDAHRFDSNKNSVVLCGIDIPHDMGLAGHSDADVGWHALADAIYGALGAGDIGYHFPPSDMQWKGAPSSLFLKHAGELVKTQGGVLNHVDVTLICEAPKIGPHRDKMVAATAALLGLELNQVSVKATTTEAMGFTGRREGIAAQASATVLLPSNKS